MEFNAQHVKERIRKRLVSLLIPALILLFLAAYLSNRIIYNIRPGEAGVLWLRFFGGTVTDRVYGEGLRLIPPWDVMYIYNIRVQQRAHEFDVLTINGLTLRLAISVRYYPEREMLGILHQKVGPEYVDTVVIPEIESVLRVLIGRLRAEEVYATERSIIEKSVNSAVEQIAQRFINVDDVIIKRIVFPPAIARAIENKMEQQQLEEAYEFRLAREEKEAERKRIEARGIRDHNQTVAASLSDSVLLWKWIQAVETSPNSKLIVTGSQNFGLPLVGNLPLDDALNFEATAAPTPVNTPAGAPTAAQPAATAEPAAPPDADAEPAVVPADTPAPTPTETAPAITPTAVPAPGTS